jgi:hypothetical protein
VELEQHWLNRRGNIVFRNAVQEPELYKLHP